jgi:dihydrofolate reductase
MRKIFLFMMTSLDGFFEGPDHDLSWHNVDAEFNEFAAKQAADADTLLFGRRTYELMARFWPTESAKRADPVIAEIMNTRPKFVVSRTLDKADWQNSTLIRDNAVEKIAELKRQPGKDIAIFGSNNLCVSLIPTGLIDEYRIMVNPVAIGVGTTLFVGLRERLSLRLVKTREFASGNVLLCYRPK